MRRKAKIILAILVIAEVVYFTASSIFLNTGALHRLINTDLKSLKLDYTYALSPLPGVVFVKGLSLRVTDSNMQFLISLQKVWVGVALHSLLKREFHTYLVKGDELSYRMRLLRKPEDIEDRLFETLPPITGLDDFIKRPKPPDAGEFNPWKVNINGVDIPTLKELWFEEYRFIGNAHVSGGFYLFPSTKVQVRPAKLHVDSGALFLGTDPFAKDLVFDVNADIKMFYPDKAPDWHPLDYVTGEIRFGAKIADVAFANHYLRDSKWIKIDKGAGVIDAFVRIADGKLQESSHIDVDSKGITVSLGKHEVSGDGPLSWKVSNKEHTLSLDLKEYRVASPAPNPQIAFHGSGFSLNVSTPQLMVSEDFKPLTIHVQLPKAEIEDMRYVNGYLPSGHGIEFTGGKGTFDADLYVSTDESANDHGHILLNADKVTANWVGTKMQGDVQFKVKLKKAKIEKQTAELENTEVSLRNVRVLGKGTDESGWWGKVALPDAKVSWGEPYRLQTKVVVSGQNLSVAAPFLSSRELPGWAENILEGGNLNASTTVDLKGKDLKVSDAQAEAGPLKVSGWLNKSGERKRGRFLFEYEPFALGVAIDNNEKSIRLQDAYKWYSVQSQQKQLGPQSAATSAD